MSALPFIPPVPIQDPSRYGTQAATPQISDSVESGPSSGSDSDEEDSVSSSSEEGSVESEKEREEWEILNDEDERNATVVVPSAVPPTYEQVMNNPNIDPVLQEVRPPPAPSQKSRKRKSKKAKGLNNYSYGPSWYSNTIS